MELRYQALAGGRSVLAGISLGRQVLLRALEAIQKEPDLPTPLLVSFDAIDAATASFLREAVQDDGDWAEVVDALNAELHTAPA